MLFRRFFLSNVLSGAFVFLQKGAILFQILEQETSHGVFDQRATCMETSSMQN